MTSARTKYPSELNRWMVSVPFPLTYESKLKALAGQNQQAIAPYIRMLVDQALTESNLVEPAATHAERVQLS